MSETPAPGRRPSDQSSPRLHAERDNRDFLFATRSLVTRLLCVQAKRKKVDISSSGATALVVTSQGGAAVYTHLRGLGVKVFVVTNEPPSARF